MRKYRIIYQVRFECLVEAETEEDAVSDAPIPEGEGASYVPNSYTVVEVAEE